jgi:UDP-N-acetylglucosamine 1-carboxyvinyltransferase
VLERGARAELPALADFLNAMGARVEGAGPSTVTIHGVTSLHPATHTVIADRIEAGTFLIAGAMAGGELTVAGMVPEHVRALLDHLAAMGVEMEEGEDRVRVRGCLRPLAVDLDPDFYPGFPTDLQAQIVAMATRARGTGDQQGIAIASPRAEARPARGADRVVEATHGRESKP